MKPITEQYLIVYYKDNHWRSRIVVAEDVYKAEEYFRDSIFATKNVDYYRIYVFTGVSEYV